MVSDKTQVRSNRPLIRLNCTRIRLRSHSSALESASDQTLQSEVTSDQTFQTEVNSDQTFQTELNSDQT